MVLPAPPAACPAATRRRCVALLQLLGSLRIGAQPVVEIEEHRRALGRRAKQVAEAAPDMRPDRLALVIGDEARGAPLAGEDVEVVEPEVDEHFLELPLAIDRARDLLRSQRLDLLAAELPGAALRFHALLFRQVARGHAPEVVRAIGERHEPRREARVVDGRGVQLLIDPARKPHALDVLDLARARAEGETVEGMFNGIAVAGDRLPRRQPAMHDSASRHTPAARKAELLAEGNQLSIRSSLIGPSGHYQLRRDGRR